MLQNLNRLAQTDQATLPHNDTLDDYLQTLDTPAVAAVRQQMISRLIRMRVLDRARVQSRLVVAVDGTGYLSFQKRHCDHCLTRKAGKHTRYSHQVLEAKLLGPAQTVLSLASVFIDNRDLTDPDVGEEKQKVRC